MNRALTATLAAAYLASIVLANYAIGHIGNPPVAPGAPHTLPVWPGIEAPSGVYVVGVTLVLRDVVQRRAGKGITFALIVAATLLSALLSPAIALASGVAFFASESVDFAIYTAVERRSFYAAVLASNAVSIVVDSVVFLALAFGSLAFVEGQIIGKAIGTLAGLAALVALRWREDHREATPAVGACSCALQGVTGLDRLLDLMARGVDQLTASRLLWGRRTPLEDYADEVRHLLTRPESGRDS